MNVKKVARRNKYVITKINSKKCLVWKLQELQKITLFLSRGRLISKHVNETGDVSMHVTHQNTLMRQVRHASHTKTSSRQLIYVRMSYTNTRH